MSAIKEHLSEKKKKTFFCKVCQVACLNRDGIYSHYKDEEHIEMEDAYYGGRYGKYFYSCLQDYILCPLRKEPLIGLQYIIQLYPEVDIEDAFRCSLCKVIGPLYFIMKHIESFKHRKNYLSIAYKNLFPLYSKKQKFYERNLAVRKHSIKVEQEEKTLIVNDSKSCSSRIGVKSDFQKYNIRRQEKLEEYKKKRSAYETQKNNILQYMETLVIASQEEAELVQNLTEELEVAINVYSLCTKPKYEKYTKRGREQSPEGDEERSSRHSDVGQSKKRNIWYEKEHKPSSSAGYSDEVQSISDKHSAGEEGSNSEAKILNIKQEPQELPTACPDREKLRFSDTLSESSEAKWRIPNVNSDIFKEVQAKRLRKHSTDVAKWESLFANHRPEMSPSIFTWSPSLNIKEESPSEENKEYETPSEGKKEHIRRASLEALSTFTLFSQGQEHGSASSETVSALRSPGFMFYTGNIFQNKSPGHKLKQSGDIDQELPCSSNSLCDEADTTVDTVVKHTESDQNKDKIIQDSQVKASYKHSSDVNANVAQASKLDHICHASSECSDVKVCEGKNLDTKAEGQDADPGVTGRMHASRRQLSPEVLQLLKGKDMSSIVHILKTLSPFYPALQELDLEVFAEVLSKTEAVTE
ncbi:uncharacterized protein [Engystomops pustulosus]